MGGIGVAASDDAISPRSFNKGEQNPLPKKLLRTGLLLIALFILAGLFIYSHQTYRSAMGPVVANCSNPGAWGYAEIGDEPGRLFSWAKVHVAGLDPRQEYEVIVYRKRNPRPAILGRFRTGFNGYGDFEASGLPLGQFDVVNVRLPGKHGTAVLSSSRV